jgi:tetratricopeptide (TPR) repeat protein
LAREYLAAEELAEVLMSYAYLYYNHRDMKESHIKVAEEYFEKAKDIYQKAPDEDVDSKYCYALVLNNLGSIYCFCKDENDKAEEYYTKALDIYKSIKGFNPLYQEDLARLYRNLGSLYFKKGDLDESKIFYNDSLYEYKGLYDNNPILYEIELQRIYNEMRLFYGHWYNDGQYDKAYKLSVLLYVIASHIYEGNKSETNIELYADSLVNISYYLLLCQEYEKSEYYSRKALEVDPEKIYAFTNLAHALLLQEGKTDEAIEIYLKYKDTLKDDFINDLNELEKLDVIPEERKEFVMKIKQIIETVE